MSTVPVRAECCQTCMHWEGRGRKIVDNGNKVEVILDYQKCELCRCLKEWREWCGSYSHYNWVRDTYRPSSESMRTDSEIFQDTITDFLKEKERIAESRPKKVLQTCSRCDGSGNVSCSNCGGSGNISCSHCDGEGGFSTVYQIEESGETFTRRHIQFLDPEIEKIANQGFKDKGWNWRAEEKLSKTFEECSVVCHKTVDVPISSKRLKIQEEVLAASVFDGDFAFPNEVTDEVKEAALNANIASFGCFIDKCKEIESKAEEWGERSGWDRYDGCSKRIKSASLEIVDSNCIAFVKFKDRFGFNRTAFVNLATERVYVNDVSNQEYCRRIPELMNEAQDNVELFNSIGQMFAQYSDFEGTTPEDYELAVACFLKAANGGCADAMDNLGNAYKKGKGVSKDLQLSAAWYARAANRDLPWGQFHLGEALEDGRGIVKDKELALAWYLKAAKNGVAKAQWRLGCRFSDGDGVQMDKELGSAWQQRAKANGYEPPSAW